MDTKIWTEESDNYTSRGMESEKGKIYDSSDRIEFANTAFENITKFVRHPNKILDIGCAFGASIYALKDKFPEAYFYGIDPGLKSIEMAKNKLPEQRFTFLNGFSDNLPFEDESFDVVIFAMVLQWIPRKKLIRTIAEANRVLKGGG